MADLCDFFSIPFYYLLTKMSKMSLCLIFVFFKSLLNVDTKNNLKIRFNLVLYEKKIKIINNINIRKIMQNKFFFFKNSLTKRPHYKLFNW